MAMNEENLYSKADAFQQICLSFSLPYPPPFDVSRSAGLVISREWILTDDIPPTLTLSLKFIT